MKAPAFKKIVIVGLGLMGGSLAAAVRKKFPQSQVVGVARRKKTIHLALRKKWIHKGFLSIKESLGNADLVVICTPVDSTQSVLSEIERFATQSVLVTDAGSVKESLCLFAEKKKWKSVRFVGAHPMVGSHEQGIEHARADLYDEGLTIVTARRSQKGFNAVFAFWKALSKQVRVMSPAEHDDRVAQISHLPHLISVCLMQTPDAGALAIAAAGFRDTTRLAAGPETVWAPIFSQNRKALSKAIKLFKQNLEQFESNLKLARLQEISQSLEKAAFRRRQIFSSSR